MAQELYQCQNSGKTYSWDDAGFVVEKPNGKSRVTTSSDSERFLPSGFDLQVHLRYPGQDQKETLEGGLNAARAGGYDAILTMPNTSPFLDTADKLQAAIEGSLAAQKEHRIHAYFSASATMDMKGDVVSDIASLVKAGAAAITDDGWGIAKDDIMKEIFVRCAENDVPFLQHAEMPGHGGVATPSQFQRSHELRPYPRTAESEMVARDVRLLEEIKDAHYHVLHISTRETLDEIKKAKDKGLNITCEVTPHHLFFDNTCIPPMSEPQSAYYKMNPPLFDPEDRKVLIASLASGDIDCVSTDHAPHETDLKQQHWHQAPFGTRGLVTALPCLLTLFDRDEISWDRLVDAYSFAGRRVIKAAGPKSILRVDTKAKWQVTSETLVGKSENSCFVGSEMTGKITEMIDG
jgi:dihydroorotase